MPAPKSSASPPFLRRVRLGNFRSIASCDVKLGPLTVLAGRNGAGKSNFLDALRFVADGLRSSLPYALEERGGVDEVHRRSPDSGTKLSIELEFSITPQEEARYAFEIEPGPEGTFSVAVEDLAIRGPRSPLGFHRIGERVESFVRPMPPVVQDRLYLVNAAGLPVFRSAYDALLPMAFYNFSTKAMKGGYQSDAGELLSRDGRNLASVVARLSKGRPAVMARIQSYLAAIVPEVRRIGRVILGPQETLQFWQDVDGTEMAFYPASMSEGTLRALGALVAVAQEVDPGRPIRLVGIEEPETALHPAAAGVLMEALREASNYTQVHITTHSPDLVDLIDVERDTLLVVAATAGRTRIAPADQASIEAIRRHLYTPGELLRMDQLQPDQQDLERQRRLEGFPDVARVS